MTEDPSSEKSFLQSITRDDFKLFIITIAATVIANVMTVVVVALAILIARWQSRPASGSHSALIVPTIASLGLTLCGFFIVAAFWRGDSPYEKFMKWSGLVIFSIMGIFAVVFTLTWIGIAEGVH